MLLAFSRFLVVLPLNVLSNYSCLEFFFFLKKKWYSKKHKEVWELTKATLHKTVRCLCPYESISQQFEVNPTIQVNMHALN